MADMAESPTLVLQQRSSQKQQQVQSQRLSQKQLLSVKLLAMSSADLRQEIYAAAARNPALTVSKDFALDGIKEVKETKASEGFSDGLRLGSATNAGKLASDNFQAALEASPDTRKTLSEHLEEQFFSVAHSPAQEKIGLALIHNLDSRGFFIFDPYSLLDKKDPLQTPELLEQTVSYIQQLDPVGTCCRNFEESLLIQAKSREDSPKAAVFILDGHFDFLNPPLAPKVLKKIKNFLRENPQQTEKYGLQNLTEEQVEKAISFIRKLNPFPAAEFSPSENICVEPDVFVEKNEETGEYSVRVNEEILPVVEISKDFYRLSLDRSRVTKSTEETEKKRSEHRFVMESVRAAGDFIDSLEFRKKTLLLAASQLVVFQRDFFEKGPRYLKPLRQKDLAQAIGVHEATVSRLANEKYLRCSQGLFKFSFFFTNAVGNGAGRTSSESGEVPASKQGIMEELKKLLEEHKNDPKPLSDQKISELLSEQGISIARRTVAKYRSQLNIESSYARPK